MMICIAAVGLWLTPTDRVEYVEVNHVFDKSGKLTFDQVIFWEWNEGLEDWVVIAWRMCKYRETLSSDEFKIKEREFQARHVDNRWQDYLAEREFYNKQLPKNNQLPLMNRQKWESIVMPTMKFPPYVNKWIGGPKTDPVRLPHVKNPCIIFMEDKGLGMGTLRVIEITGDIEHTHTVRDPEVDNRQIWHESRRRGLSVPKIKKKVRKPLTIPNSLRAWLPF